MTRYTPSRLYYVAAFGLMAVALQCLWFAFHWPGAWAFAILAALLAGVVLALARRPPIEIHPRHLRVGTRSIDWVDIQRLDRVRHLPIPLVVVLTLTSGARFLLIYPGEPAECRQLLAQLRRSAHTTIIGIDSDEDWSDAPPMSLLESAPDRKPLPGPRYPLLSEADEAEVERLYQRLKTVGHLDPKSPGSDE
ncbi:MAG: DUF3093 family protein [Bryobacterales bacterium]|nr:DUF3093 family protein [Bryobacterales bacterium]